MKSLIILMTVAFFNLSFFCNCYSLEITRTECVFSTDYKTLNDIKADLILKAKDAALKSIFGEAIKSYTKVDMGMLREDTVISRSYGILRMSRNPEFYNGQNLGEMCVKASFSVSEEDLKKFEPKTIKIMNYCYKDQTVSIQEMKTAAYNSALKKVVSRIDQKLCQLPINRLNKLIVLKIYNEKFDADGSICMDVSGEYIPFFIENFHNELPIKGIKEKGMILERAKVINNSGNSNDINFNKDIGGETGNRCQSIEYELVTKKAKKAHRLSKIVSIKIIEKHNNFNIYEVIMKGKLIGAKTFVLAIKVYFENINECSGGNAIVLVDRK